MTKFSSKYRCINHLPSNQRWRFSENPPSTEIIFPCLPGQGHDRRDTNWAPQGDFSNSAWREQAMERVAKELETGACALILFRKPSPSWLHLKKSRDMITLGRVLSYATEIIGASGSIRALSSFSEASSPPRALSGTLRRTNLNKTWWERVQVHGNREVKPIPSEVWSNQALAARMDLFDRAMPLIILHQQQRNLDVRVAMSETVAIGDPESAMTSQIAGGTNLIVTRSKGQSPIWNCHDLWVLCQFWRVHDLSIRLKIRPPALQAYWILWPSPSLDDFQFQLCRASITGSPEVFPTGCLKPNLAEEFEEEKGITPLYVAATWGYPELVKYLLQKEAIHIGWVGGDHESPLLSVGHLDSQLVCFKMGSMIQKHNGSKWTILTDSWYYVIM